MKNYTGLSLWLAALAGVLVVSCAKGSSVIDTGGGGFGGGASGMGGASGEGPANTSGSASASSASGSGASASSSKASSAASSGSGAKSSSSASSSAVSSSASGPMCNAPNHLCNGQCLGNTPDTGCTTSVNCVPCPSPVNGTSICTPGGICDFTCTAPYVKNGAVCSCGAACCTDADCGGGGATCVGGVCMAPPSCNQGQCSAQCIAMCIPKFGIGICLNNMCICQCQ